jgi:hypothetical protein
VKDDTTITGLHNNKEKQYVTETYVLAPFNSTFNSTNSVPLSGVEIRKGTLNRLRLPPVKARKDFTFPSLKSKVSSNVPSNTIRARPPPRPTSLHQHLKNVEGDHDDAWLADAIVEHAHGSQETTKQAAKATMEIDPDGNAIYHL